MQSKIKHQQDDPSRTASELSGVWWIGQSLVLLQNHLTMYNTKLWAMALMLIFLTGCAEDDDPEVEPTSGTVTLDCDYFSAARTLTDNPDVEIDYLVTCKAEVTQPLIIEPGVVIAFAADAGLQVTGQGSITAEGQILKPIVFQGQLADKGSWSGIYIETNNVANKFNWTEVRNGGGSAFNSNDQRGNVILAPGGRLSLLRSTLTESASYGLNAQCFDCDLEFGGNTINETEIPVRLNADLAHTMIGTSVMTGNTNDYVETLIADEITEQVSWNKLTIPYRLVQPGLFDVQWVESGSGGLSFGEGVIVEFSANVGIAARNGAYLLVGGTDLEPVILTGASEAPGSWKGLGFYTNNVNNRVSHAEISYAGSGPFDIFNALEGTVVVGPDSRLDINNSILRDGGATCGIEATSPNVNLINTNNTFSNITTDVCN